MVLVGYWLQGDSDCELFLSSTEYNHEHLSVVTRCLCQGIDMNYDDHPTGRRYIH